jgi:hypothetical protein
MVDPNVTARGNLVPAPAGRSRISFTDDYGTYSGRDATGRQWLISPTRTGWRLEFRDPGDKDPTYAGTHPTVRDAQRAACS